MADEDPLMAAKLQLDYTKCAVDSEVKLAKARSDFYQAAADICEKQLKNCMLAQRARYLQVMYKDLKRQIVRAEQEVRHAANKQKLISHCRHCATRILLGSVPTSDRAMVWRSFFQLVDLDCDAAIKAMEVRVHGKRAIPLFRKQLPEDVTVDDEMFNAVAAILRIVGEFAEVETTKLAGEIAAAEAKAGALRSKRWEEVNLDLWSSK